jgi:anti-sigma-K factor RskA
VTGPRRLGGLSCAEADELAPAFVLGALDPADAEAVRAHLGDCPERHDAVEALGGTVGHLAELAEPVEPPAALKARLMAAVADDLGSRASGRAAMSAAATGSATLPPAPAGIGAEPTPLEVERARRRSVLSFVMAAAAVLLIVILGASNLALRGELDAAAEQAGVLREAIAAVGRPGARVASVTGTEAQPGASGFVVIPTEGDGYLAVHGLAAPPVGQTYAAWTIDASGVPVAAGLASPHDGLAVFVLPSSRSAEVVALTLEPKGGSTTPTMPIQVAGEVGG